jgi:hypothetical protein
LALSLTALTAQAAPAGGSTADLKATAGASASVEKADYRCWWRHGRRVCRYYDDGPYYYYGPSIDLRFGGGHRHHRHHHHRR